MGRRYGARWYLDAVRVPLLDSQASDWIIRTGRPLWPAALAAWALDVATCAGLLAAGVPAGTALTAGFAVSVLGATFLARDGRADRLSDRVYRIGWLVAVALLAFALRGGVLSLVGGPPVLAILPAAVAGAAVQLAGWTAWAARRRDPDASWPAVAALGVAYLFVLRLVYIGQLELLPEEAYYWCYSRHLDVGYLDHPPMVAWLIWLSTRAGDTELMVRLPAPACWSVAAVFVFKMARDELGRDGADRALLLAAALPFFFVTGTVMMPDAPLIACWAGALYFLRRALVDGHAAAWWGAGLCLGLGLLSKYTIVLLGGAAVLFVALDRPSRRWLAAPQPYLSAALALALFSPVVAWNAGNEWASFVFQGPRRLAEARFDLPMLIVFILIAITPTGVAGIVLALKRPQGRERLFAMVFAGVPLAVFTAASLRSETKLNWTGPLWLAALPAMAAGMRAGPGAGRAAAALAASWPPTLAIAALVYGVVLFYYPVHGLRGIALHYTPLAMSWRDLSRGVARIVDEVAVETGEVPVVVGMDSHRIASELSFYDPGGAGIASRHLIYKAPALMFERWTDPSRFEGRDLVLVDHVDTWLTNPRLTAQSERLGPVREIVVENNGQPVRAFYARVLYGYRPLRR